MTSEGRTNGCDFIFALQGLGATEVSECTNGRHEWAV